MRIAANADIRANCPPPKMPIQIGFFNFVEFKAEMIILN